MPLQAFWMAMLWVGGEVAREHPSAMPSCLAARNLAAFACAIVCGTAIAAAHQTPAARRAPSFRQHSHES
jgi:hypothetical protein